MIALIIASSMMTRFVTPLNDFVSRFSFSDPVCAPDIPPGSSAGWKTTSNSPQAGIVLGHDNGPSAGPNDYSGLKAHGVELRELVRFEAPRLMRVTEIKVFCAGLAGRLVLHFWKDIDALIPFRHFEFDAAPPVVIDLGKGNLGKWVVVNLRQSGLELQRGQRVFVGHIVGRGPQICCDRKLDDQECSVVELFNPRSRGSKQVKIFSPAGDFMVRLSGAPLAEDRTVRFEAIFQRPGTVTSLAWGDIDGDGYEDLIVNGSIVLKNLHGQGFRDVTSVSGLAGSTGDFGLLADFNNDGTLDLFQGTSSREAPDVMWHNDGHGRFTRLASAILPERLFGRSACAFDFDRDGKLDLFIANGARFGDLQSGDPSRLYRNLGNGRFAPVYKDLFAKPAKGVTPPFGSSVVAGDLFGDGWPELFLGTYRLEPDQLWTFHGKPQNVANSLGVAAGPAPAGLPGGGHCLGAAFADPDNDGALDLIVLNLMHPDWRGYQASNESYLFKNKGSRRFKRILLRSMGIDYEETPANPILQDFDNDGRLDFFHQSMYHSSNLYVWRAGRWTDRTASSGLRSSQATAAAACDFDHDGRMDLAVADKTKGLIIYRNISPKQGWIELKLKGTDCNRGAVGAIVRIRVGRQTLTRLVAAGRGLACQDSATLHFGLGQITGQVNGTVAWPCGRTTKFGPFSPRRIHNIIEPKYR